MNVEDFIRAKQEAMKPEHRGDLNFLRLSYKNLLGQMLGKKDALSLQVADTSLQLQTHTLNIRKYLPKQASEQLLIFFHGGGFVLGDLDTHDGLCCNLALSTNTEVVSIDYRLSPEHPFPAPLEDARDSIAAIMATTDKKIFLCGESAGANLAASALLFLPEEQAKRIQGIILMYPFLDMTLSHFAGTNLPSLFSKEELHWYAEAYCPQKDLKNHPLVSPIFAENITHFAPALFLLAGEDPLRQEGQILADLLAKNNFKTVVEKREGMPHGYLLIEPLFGQQIAADMKKIGDFLTSI